MSKLEETVVPSKQRELHLNYAEAGNTYLIKLNNHIISLGLKPIYETFDDFKAKQRIKEEKAYHKLHRAYNWFVNKKKPSRGNPPELSTYAFMPPTNPEVLPTFVATASASIPPAKQSSSVPSKRDFSSFQMTETNDKMEEIVEPNSLFAKYYRDRSRGFKNADFKRDWSASMNSLYGITGKGFNISHNPDYLRKDYFDTVVKKKHPDWKYSRTEDLDGDKINDVIIRDGDNNVRYFNGYGLSSNKFSLQKQAYMADPTTNDYDYKAFLTKYHETHPPKPKKTYADVVKAFVKYLEKTINTAIGDKKATKMLFKNSNLAGRVESIVNRFVALPVILLMKEYKINEIEPIIFAVHDKENAVKDKYYRILLAIYRDPELKEDWNKPSVRVVIAKVASLVMVKLAEMINANVDGFINTMFYTKNDMSIGKICYNAMLEVNNMSTDQLNAINVDEIIKLLTGK